MKAVRQRLVSGLVCCAFALSSGAMVCGCSSSSQAPSATEASETGVGDAASDESAPAGKATSENRPAPSGTDETPSDTDATPADTAVPEQGTPQITMGDLSLVHAHETDEGVGADVVIQVTNTGDVPLLMTDACIRIGDEGGNVIVEDAGDGIFTGPTYLGVGDVGFIYTDKPLLLPAGYAADQSYLAQGTATLIACKEVHQFPVSNLGIADGGREMPVVSGTVTNNKDEKVPLIELTVAYTDNDGHMLGVASELELDLAPGESRDFEIHGNLLPVGCTMAVISDYDVMAVSPTFEGGDEA